MKVAIPYEYTEEAIPPRCRKPRRVRMKDTMTVTIHELSGDDAPVAIVQRDPLHVGNRPEKSSIAGGASGSGRGGIPRGASRIHASVPPAHGPIRNRTWPSPECAAVSDDSNRTPC